MVSVSNIFLLSAPSGLVAKLCATLATPWTTAHQAPLSMNARILE